MKMEKDEMIVMLLTALTALANESVAYIRDKKSDGKFLIAAANRAEIVTREIFRELHGSQSIN